MATNNPLDTLRHVIGLQVKEDLVYGDFTVRVADGATMHIPREYVEDYPDAVKYAIMAQHFTSTDPAHATSYMQRAAQNMGMQAQDVSKLFRMNQAMGSIHGANTVVARPMTQDAFPRTFGEAGLVTFIVGSIPEDHIVNEVVYPFSDAIPEQFQAKAGMLLAAISGTDKEVVNLDGVGSIRSIYKGSARLLRIFSFQ